MMNSPPFLKYFYLLALTILPWGLPLKAGEMSFKDNCADCLFGFIRVEDRLAYTMENAFQSSYSQSGVCRMINRTPKNNDNSCTSYDSYSSRQNFIIPQTLEKIVYQEQDAPIYLIQELHQKSLTHWKKFDPAASDLTNSPKSGLDFTSMREYNLLAAKLWIQLIQCNSGSAVVAREKLYLNEPDQLCTNNSAESSNLLKSLSGLAKNFQLLLEGASGTIVGSYFSDPETIQFLKNLHPILTEFLFINWAALFNEKEGDSLLKISALSLKSMEFNINGVGNKSRSRQQGGISSIDDVYALLVPSILKAIAIVSYDNSDDKCAIYGLWPGLNQVVVSFRPPFENSTRFTPELLQASMAIETNCQNSHLFFADATNIGNGPYGRYFDSILNNKRAQYEILYLDEH